MSSVIRHVRFCFFFFSSRRRHTRCSRDWSSDVCSSDLIVLRLNAELGVQPEDDLARRAGRREHAAPAREVVARYAGLDRGDRKSTRLNSSHGYISYAVFCLKKKKNTAVAQTLV